MDFILQADRPRRRRGGAGPVERYFAAVGNRPDLVDPEKAAYFYWLKGDLKKALVLFGKAYEENASVSAGTALVMMADEVGDSARDAVMEELCTKHQAKAPLSIKVLENPFVFGPVLLASALLTTTAVAASVRVCSRRDALSMFPGNELEHQPIDPLGFLVLHPMRRLRKPFEPAVVAEGQARLGRTRVKEHVAFAPDHRAPGRAPLGRLAAVAGGAGPRDTSGSSP